MPQLDVRAFVGHDNWTRHRFVADVYNDDGTLQQGVPVKFASATDVHLVFRPTDDKTSTFTHSRSAHAASFDANDSGDLYVRYGEVPLLDPGRSYEVRLIVFDLDNPDGFVVADYSEDKRTDTIRVLVA